MNFIHAQPTPGIIPSVYPLDVPRGCILYYDMQDLGDKIIDHSGHGNHGTNHGTVPVAWKNGMVRRFDYADQSYIEIGDLTEIPVGHDFAIEIWVRHDINAPFMLMGMMGRSPDCVFNTNANGGGNEFTYGDANTGDLSSDQSPDAYNQLVVSVNHTTMQVEFYQNGGNYSIYYPEGLVLFNYSPVPFTTDGSGGNWQISYKGGDYADQYYKGDIALLRMFDRAVSRREVTNMYNEHAWKFGLPGAYFG